jgi:hypothetical protein
VQQSNIDRVQYGASTRLRLDLASVCLAAVAGIGCGLAWNIWWLFDGMCLCTAWVVYRVYIWCDAGLMGDIVRMISIRSGFRWLVSHRGLVLAVLRLVVGLALSGSVVSLFIRGLRP